MIGSLRKWLVTAWPVAKDRAGQLRRVLARWARYPQDGATVPRWARYLLVLGAIMTVSSTFGIVTAQVHANFGPHDATYEVTVDSVITLDVGPLGTVQLDSPAPLGLGAYVTIEEIPTDLTSLDSTQMLGALGGDVEKYLQFFAAPGQTIDMVVRLLVDNAILRAVLAAGTLIIIMGTVAFLMGPNRRTELAYPLARQTWPLVASFVIVAVVAGQATITRSRSNLEEVGASTSAVFVNTPLEGARITGRLSGVIDSYGGQLLGVYEENENFYAQASIALEEAFEVRRSLTERDQQFVGGVATPLLLTTPPVIVNPAQAPESSEPQADSDENTDLDQNADSNADPEVKADPDGNAVIDPGADTELGPAVGGGEPANPVERSAPQETGKDWAEPDLVTMLLVSDLHCNVGMAPLITIAAEQGGASIILNAGDSTINGTELERFCVEAFVKSAPAGTEFVQADGNHDSESTSRQAAKAGAIILDGTTVQVQGIKFLGDSDPNETRLGTGSVSVSGESYEAAGTRLADVACREKNVDILMVHTPKVGDVPMASGCVPYQISGHMHRRIGPNFVGEGVRYVNSSSAGAVLNKVTIGPLNGTAEMTLLKYDRANNAMVSMQVISVTTDATAVVGAPLRFPQPGDNLATPLGQGQLNPYPQGEPESQGGQTDAGQKGPL